MVPAAGLLDSATLFPFEPRAVYLEIGFGDGERLAREAADFPDFGFLACEPFVNGVAKLLARIEMGHLNNVLIHHGDARHVLERLPNASLDLVYLLYPDPWPKRRHRKRRFLTDDTLNILARCMKKGSTLRFASDIDDYSGWVLARLLRADAFQWTADIAADWRVPWPDWRPTRYERKALAEGREGVYLTFRRL